MYTLSYILYGIGALFLISFIVFLVLFLMKKGNRKINLILFIVSIVISVGCFSYGGYHQYDVHKKIDLVDNAFLDSADKFTDLYSKTKNDIESAGDALDEDWKGAIESEDEDYDPNKVVTSSLAHNGENIVEAELNMKKLKKYLNDMNDYDIGDYDYDSYKSAYDKLNKLVNFVRDPEGSYNHYRATYTKYKHDVDDSYKNIQ